tara:strand:- start:134 stop:730 length:597 start_codon:yes stop_codon:yes gene_type:complete
MARTLNNFGVPTDSGDSVSGSGILQPKLNYRFRVVVAGFGGTGTSSQEFTRQVMNVSRPKVSHESIPLDSYNSRMYVMGKHTWEPITITLRDDIANNLTKLVGRQVQSQLDHKSQRGPSAGTNYKFSTLIEILDGNSGNATEQWQLEGCFVTNADYSQTDYAVSDPVTITLTLQYDNAVLNDDIFPDQVFTPNSTIAG